MQISVAFLFLLSTSTASKEYEATHITKRIITTLQLNVLDTNYIKTVGMKSKAKKVQMKPITFFLHKLISLYDQYFPISKTMKKIMKKIHEVLG